jgi:hypothetical protein
MASPLSTHCFSEAGISFVKLPNHCCAWYRCASSRPSGIWKVGSLGSWCLVAGVGWNTCVKQTYNLADPHLFKSKPFSWGKWWQLMTTSWDFWGPCSRQIYIAEFHRISLLAFIYIYIQKCMCMSNVFKTRTGSVQGNTFSKPMNFRVNTVSLSTVNKIVNQSIETGWGAHVSSFCFITSPPVWTDEIAFPSSFHTWRNYGISFHRKVSQQLIWLEHIRTIFRTYTYHTYYCYCLVCSCSISFVWLFQNGIETSVHVNLAPISTGVPLVTLALWWTWEVWNLATHSAKQCLLNPSWVMVQTGFILSTFVWDGG